MLAAMVNYGLELFFFMFFFGCRKSLKCGPLVVMGLRSTLVQAMARL
jgi:hypothetical protein